MYYWFLQYPIDIDECQNGICEDICTNIEGSFECGCREGFALSSNQRNCEGMMPLFLGKTVLHIETLCRCE